MRRRISRCGLEKRRVCVTMQTLPAFFARVEHALRHRRRFSAHRNLDLDVLALRQREQRLIARAGRSASSG